MDKCGFTEWLAGHTLLTISLLLAAYAGGSPPGNDARAAELAKWRSLIPAVESMLIRQGNPCSGERPRTGPADAADFAGSSIALVDVCPLGAYTELMVAMRLEGSEPVLASFRKANHKVDLEFAQGSPVIHGRDVKLVPETSPGTTMEWTAPEPCSWESASWTPMFGTASPRHLIGTRNLRSKPRHCEDLKQQGH